MLRGPQGEGIRLAVALLIPLAAFGLQWGFWDFIQPYAWLLFSPAVYLSAWIGGRRGGLAATVLSVGLVWYFFIPPQHSFAIERPLTLFSIAVFAGMGILFSLFHERLRKSNEEVAAAALRVGEATAQKAAEARIARLTQLYAATNQCHQSIVHSASVEELLSNVCRIVVQEGGMKMAGISRIDRATGQLRQVASFGSGTEYLEGIEISLDPDNPLGRGPLGTAVRENKPVWCQDFQKDPCTAPWHERGLQFGWLACASLPLRENGRSMGALTFYSGITGAFDEEARKLLAAIADDMSFAMDNFNREEDRRHAKEAAKREQALSNAIIESIPGAFFLLDENARFVRWNAYERDEIIGKPEALVASTNAIDTIHTDDRASVAARMTNILKSGVADTAEVRILMRGGPEIRWFLLTGRQMAIDGKPFLLGIGIDITERKRAELALSENRDMIVKLTTQVPGVVYQYRLFPDGRSAFPFASPGMMDIYEVTPGEVREDATPVFGRLHPLDADRITASIQESARTLEPFHCEFRVVLPRQGLRWRLSDAIPERTDDGGTLWHGIISDITERKKAEEELQNLRTAVEQSGTTIVITDPQGTIEYVNPIFEQSTGYSAAEALGRNPRVLKSGKQGADFYKNLWSTISSGKIWRGQFHNRRKDGALYWESATISPVFNENGEIIHYIAVKEDISEVKSLEANLIEALRRAESANQAKSEFLAVMSHELRTPLNGVLGFADLLSHTPLDEEQKGYALTITNSGKHLLEVVNDILDFSSIEKGRLKLDISTVPTDELVETCCQAVRKAAADKGLEFRYEAAADMPVRITGDARRIRQLLFNLLGNAVKFTSKGSVVLRATVTETQGKAFLNFAIEDTGPGISPETLSCLFKPFTQADSSLRRPFEGTGLGLAISQRLVEAMGGMLTVDSTPGKGSTFTLKIPLEPEMSMIQSPAPPAASPATVSSGGLVLVVDDDRINTILARKFLENIGLRAEVAVNGQAALDAFAPGKYCAILMDMQMPVMNGLEATVKIREIEAATESHVPIIALTANVMPGDRERCMASGMDDFLTKPFSRDDLAAKLTPLVHTAPDPG
ncbi:MAG: PAS domain S-box protein [Terrimicrobiaceae bacterium]